MCYQYETAIVVSACVIGCLVGCPQELLDLSVTTNQVFPKSKPAFVIASRQDWLHQRVIAGSLPARPPLLLQAALASHGCGLTSSPDRRDVAGRLTRAAYQPSFAYALPFHLPPVRSPPPPQPLPIFITPSWAGGRRWRWWCWADGPTNMSRARSTATRRPFPTYVQLLCATVSAWSVLTRRAESWLVGGGQVYRGLQANAERGHAVQVVHHCTPGVASRRGASLLDDGVLDVTRTCPRD
jgi:hypothetical protein